MLTKKNSAFFILISFLLFSFWFSQKVFAQETYQKGIVNTSILNVRDKPSTTSNLLGTINKNTEVNIISISNNWGKINFKSSTGYVSMDYLTIKDPNAFEPFNKKMKSTASLLNVREKPTLDSKVVGSIKKNEVITVIAKNQKWVKFRKDNRDVYVSLEHLVVYTETNTNTNTSSSLSGSYKSMTPIVPYMNVRKEANTYSTILTQINQKNPVNVYPYSSTWGIIQVNGSQGYVYLPLLKVATTTTTKYGKITASSLNIRSAATTQSNVVGVLKNGDIIKTSNIQNKWAEIQFTNSNGTTVKGFISTDYIDFNIAQQEPVKEEPVVEQPKPTYTIGYVNASSLNVRKTKDTSSEIVGALSKGAKVEILSVENNWGKIKFNNQDGYISMTYISFEPINETPVQSSPTKIGIVNASTLNIRSGPSTNDSITGQLVKGNEVEILDELSGWYKIKYESKQGYVSSIYIDLKTNQVVQDSSLKGKTILLDPGHGGTDPGAQANGLNEADVVLDISLRLKTQLQNRGANVLMTRSTDVFLSLTQRATISNNSNADLFISVHANAAESTAATGIESFYYSSDASIKLTQAVQRNMLANSPLTNRGVKSANFYVLKYNNKPSTLVELGFITNSYDASLLRDSNYKQKMANSLANGVVEYFN